MRVKLKNVGDGMRVVYATNGSMVSIPIGQERTVDLHGRTVTKLRDAQAKGDTLHLAPASERVRVLKPGETPPAPPPAPVRDTPKLGEGFAIKASEALAQAENLDYHALLGMVGRVVPDNKLPPRPTKAQMLDVLRAAASKEG